jgi:large subunit ribosomal protein L18
MNKNDHKIQRQQRTRKKLAVSNRIRLSVHRSNQYVYAQIIDDAKGVTLATVSEKILAGKGTRMEKAKTVGVEIAKKAKAKKVTNVVFDKGSYSYHGRVKAVAEGAREGGLSF